MLGVSCPKERRKKKIKMLGKQKEIKALISKIK